MKSLVGFMIRLCFLSLVLSVSLVLPACGPDMEQESFNLTLQYPDGEEEDLGVITGLAECKTVAAARAEETELKEGEWSFNCCHMTDDDACTQKVS